MARVPCALMPSADLLFDHGWISFKDDGRLIVASRLPEPVSEKLGLDLADGRQCGTFTNEQASFLDYHRDSIFGHPDAQDGLIGRLFD